MNETHKELDAAVKLILDYKPPKDKPKPPAHPKPTSQLVKEG